MCANTIDRTLPWPRRAVLKGLGLSVVAAGLAATALGRYPDRPRAAAGALEDTSSTVDFVVYAGVDGLYGGDAQTADADVRDPSLDFGFPVLPLAAGTDPAGALFDTTDATVSADGETIHYFLQFGGRRTPYQLGHEGGGTYRSREASVAFEWTASERFPLPFFAVGHPYRAVVREVVQLYEPGGAFDWSVTRTDFFDRPTGAHVVSVLTVVWDEDGPDNESLRDRGFPGRPVDHAEGPTRPSFPQHVTPTVGGLRIEGAVASLVRSGVSTGGDG